MRRAILIFIVFVYLMILSIARADELNITFRNDTQYTVVVYLFSGDHNVYVNGRRLLSPMTVHVGEIKSGKELKVPTRPYNLSPYRYILKWETVHRYKSNEVNRRTFTINPRYKYVLITSKEIHLKEEL